jgi:proteasome lid subunit RPN8/RPN11
MSSKPSSSKDAAPVKVAESSSVNHKPVRRLFPGPRGAQARLRVAVDREAHAELLAHAKESLHAEVCGVLVGEEGVDDEGSFVHVQAVIRGAQASGGSTHVTFTHETWEAIHKAMERDHPKLRMMGWYHTHPGFGVEFSEMDLFIQRNFFSAPSQIALVTDPVGGTVAIAMNTGGGQVEYLPRYWVDGREHPSVVPIVQGREGSAAGPVGSADVQALEHRLNQMALATEDLRTSLHRFLLFVGAIVAVGIVSAVVLMVQDRFRERNKPPELNHFIPIPVKVGDKNVLIGVGVVKWEVPDELNGLMLDMEKLRLEEEEEARKKENEKSNDKAAGGDAKPSEPQPQESKPASPSQSPPIPQNPAPGEAPPSPPPPSPPKNP